MALFLLFLAALPAYVVYISERAQGTRRLTGALVANALYLAFLTVALAVYVAGEDSYLADGTSVWDAHPDLHALTIGAAAGGLAAMVVAALAIWKQATLARLAGLVGVAATVGIGIAYVANGSN
jgi:hypothetical protein